MAGDSEQSLWIPLHYAEVGAVTEKGGTALHHAAQSGSNQISGVLLGADSRLDARTVQHVTSGGITPLMIAQHDHPTNAALLALLSGDAPAQPLGLLCDHCGKTAEEASVRSLKDCGKCYVVRYCGKEFQVAAWPEHKEACKTRVKEREDAVRVRIV
jgi:hypothetical protein